MAGELLCENGLRCLKVEKKTDMLKVYKTAGSIE